MCSAYPTKVGSGNETAARVHLKRMDNSNRLTKRLLEAELHVIAERLHAEAAVPQAGLGACGAVGGREAGAARGGGCAQQGIATSG